MAPSPDQATTAAQALREDRAHVEHLDETATGRRRYLAYGRLAAHPEGTPRA